MEQKNAASAKNWKFPIFKVKFISGKYNFSENDFTEGIISEVS